MKMADGGYRPAHNMQCATTNDKQIIIGVDVTNEGTDSGQMSPMLEQIERRTGKIPKEYLVDGGFNSHAEVTKLERRDVTVYAPVKTAKKEGVDPYAEKASDTKEVSAWRKRMKTKTAKEIYKERSATAEFPNAGFRNRGLRQFPVRGLVKTKAIALWHALVHNLQMIMTHEWLPVFTHAGKQVS